MKIVIVFSGYGNQFVGMGKELYDDSRIVQEYFEEAYNCLNVNFIKLCFASSDQELSKISNAYPSIFLVSCALYELLKQEGIKADLVTGYGIGHYAALFAAHGITFPDGLYLTKKLASFYEEALPGMDVAIIKVDNLDERSLKKLCKEFNEDIEIAAYNSDMQHILSGKSAAINKIKLILKKIENVKVHDLNPGMGLHSQLMNNIAEQYKIYLEKVDFKDLQIPFISNINAKEIVIGKKVKDYLVKSINLPIKWNKIMDNLADYDLIIEIGPGKGLSELIKTKYPEKTVISFNTKSDLEEIKKLLFKENNVE